MDTKEAITRIGDKIETDAVMYRNMIENGSIVRIEEKVAGGTVVVIMSKESECK